MAFGRALTEECLRSAGQMPRLWKEKSVSLLLPGSEGKIVAND